MEILRSKGKVLPDGMEIRDTNLKEKAMQRQNTNSKKYYCEEEANQLYRHRDCLLQLCRDCCRVVRGEAA